MIAARSQAQEPVAAGWYGKLPSLGDFASRRLHHGFIEAWDHWLADGLATWREREPAAWLQRYLHSPSWRFVLAPGVLPAPVATGCWVGVLMPSVDRVGRYFPLTLALHRPTLPQSPAEAAALLRWLQQLNDVALDALDEDWDAEQLETALLRLGPPAAPDADGATCSVSDAPAQTLLQGLTRQACWTYADAQGAAHTHTTRGLPRGPDFEALLGAPVQAPPPHA
jgi:type VI secretion system protein ImpM